MDSLCSTNKHGAMEYCPSGKAEVKGCGADTRVNVARHQMSGKKEWSVGILPKFLQAETKEWYFSNCGQQGLWQKMQLLKPKRYGLQCPQLG